jgi:adenylosuccinate synthase
MKAGFSDVLIGLQYGDEGKARIIDTIAEEYDVIARFNGGSNAGHTIEADGVRISLHQVPSGVFYQEKILYVGSGCVVNPVKLVGEIAEVASAGVSLDGRFHISSLATLVQPHHVLVDQLTGSAIGTTGQGIGPAYSDRARRLDGSRLLNVRVGDLLADRTKTFGQVRENLAHAVKERGCVDYDMDQAMAEFEQAASAIVRFIEPDTLFMSKLANKGLKVLFEGAQSFMLDVVKGSVPYVTSSSTLAAAAYVGGDLPPKLHRKTIGVAKAIMSRVGWGPFVSELGGTRSEEYCMTPRPGENIKEIESTLDIARLIASEDPYEVGVALRVLGNEYGATTGRPRRVGYLDLVQLAYAVKVNGVDEIYLNKCDTLSDWSKTRTGTMPVVSGYRWGERNIDYVPAAIDVYRGIGVLTDRLPGFSADISAARSTAQLPNELTALIERIESVACPVRGIGVGPRREQYVLMGG